MDKITTERLLYLIRSGLYDIEISPAGAIMAYPIEGVPGIVERFNVEHMAAGGPVAPGTYEIGGDPSPLRILRGPITDLEVPDATMEAIKAYLLQNPPKLPIVSAYGTTLNDLLDIRPNLDPETPDDTP